MNKTVKEIVIEYLENNGYDGLYADDCGCPIDDLFLYECGTDCQPGYKTACDPDTCTLDGDCDFHIGPEKEG